MDSVYKGSQQSDQLHVFAISLLVTVITWPGWENRRPFEPSTTLIFGKSSAWPSYSLPASTG
ncbi:MAG: hypothetical protein ACI9BO_002047 [Zhongshania sp.]|jgi:hypothetical protein